MSRYQFLVDTYDTERLKVLSTWSMLRDDDLPIRPHPSDPRGRSVHEQMVHQCVSEDLWFRTMIGIDVGASPFRRSTRASIGVVWYTLGLRHRRVNETPPAGPPGPRPEGRAL